MTSLFILLLMTGYVSTLAKKWLWYEDDAISTVLEYDDKIDEWDTIYQNQTDLVPAFQIFDMKNLKPLKVEDLSQYATFEFELMFTDYSKLIFDQSTDLGLKEC